MTSSGSSAGVTADHITQLVHAELAAISDPRVLAHVRGLLVPPEPFDRHWNYGPGDTAYPCWAVLDHPASNTGIAYCEEGFGPRRPWGLVHLKGSDNMSIGMDSGLFDTFLSAYFDSHAASELPIWQVFERRGGEAFGPPLTAESDSDSTWSEIDRLQLANPGIKYIGDQQIYRPES